MHKQPELILASASPRRKEYLSLLGCPYRCIIPDVDESCITDKRPSARVMKTAAMKANAVAKDLACGWVIGADTLVAIDGKLLGKPAHEQEACEMLRQLQNRRHAVYTGVSIADAAHANSTTAYQRTLVDFAPMSEQEIIDYVATQEPMDKAGAYAIQGRGSVYIKGIHGCYYNVLGLPIRLVYEMLQDFCKN